MSKIAGPGWKGGKWPSWMGVLVGIFGVGVVVGVFLIGAVVVVRVEPIVYSPPPSFGVEREPMLQAEASGVGDESLVESVEPIETGIAEGGADEQVVYTREELGNATSALPYIVMMKHADPALRLMAVERFLHMDAQVQFGVEIWDLVGEDESAIEAAFYEGLVDFVETQTDDDGFVSRLLMYIIATMPGSDEKSIEMLAWVSANHSTADVREQAMYYVTEHAPGSALALEVVRQRRNDPDSGVRWSALQYRIEMMGTQFLP